MNARLLPLSIGALLTLGAAPFILSACSEARAGDDPASARALVDQPIAAHQVQLLQIAFDAATKMPVVPHIKNRSRAQEAVVEAAIELEQPLLARRYIEKIDNWRRGMGYADLAFYCARKGLESEVQRHLDLASEVVAKYEDESLEENTAQGWRRDRIKVRIAQTHALLGQGEQAAQFEAGVVPSETGKVAAAQAMVLGKDEFEQHVDALEPIIATSDLDQVRNALDVYAELFDRFYGDEARRAIVEEKVKTGGYKVPSRIRLELMMKLVETALAHGDQPKALELVKDTKSFMDSVTCEYIPMVARLAGLRHRAGDSENAHKEADASLAKYQRERETIVNIERAEFLRPLAEAYQAMGDSAAARKVYALAIEEGFVNPNSRPRAEDLAATCVSMALYGFEPDPELWVRIHEINEKLGDPW